MRLHYVITTSIVFALLIAGRAAAQPAGAAVMLPGLWEITVQTRSPIVGPPITHTVCIDKAHIARPDPPRSRSTDDCQVLPDAAAANETAYTIRCAKRKVTSSARFSYSGDHFAGTVSIMNADGEIQQVYTAKRVSDCDSPLPEPNPAPPVPAGHE